MSDDDAKTASSSEGSGDDIDDLVPSEDTEPLPEDNLTHRQMTFANLKAQTGKSPGELEEILDISTYKRRKWNNDKHVQAYIKKMKRQYADEEIQRMNQRHNQFFRNEISNELMERFAQDPEEAIKDHFDDVERVSEKTIEKFRDRFPEYASFDKMIKAFQKVDKMTRLDQGEATERTEQNLANMVRKRHMQRKAKLEKKNKVKGKADDVEVSKSDTFEDFEDKVQILDDDEEVDDHQDGEVREMDESSDDDEVVEVEEEITEMEQWEVT